MFDLVSRKVVVTRDAVFEEKRCWDWEVSGSDGIDVEEPLVVSYSVAPDHAEADTMAESPAKAEKTTQSSAAAAVAENSVSCATPSPGRKAKPTGAGSPIPFDLTSMPTSPTAASAPTVTPYSEPSQAHKASVCSTISMLILPIMKNHIQAYVCLAWKSHLHTQKL